MATIPVETERDFSPLKDIHHDLREMHRAFHGSAVDFATSYWIHLIEGGASPSIPHGMHGYQVKAIKEVVRDRWMEERAKFRSAA